MLYSNFINSLAQDLKDRGLGIMVGGVLVPLLMYADDIVMMAGSISELQLMNDVVTEFAFKNRCRMNGDKSAVMAFNAAPELKRRVQQHTWTLSGERVEVKTQYKYLGVDVLERTVDWRTHVNRITAKARARSNDLLWTCRRDKGMRPRSAVTMWKALVRPIIEYAAEIWGGEISAALSDRMEKVQTDFGRAILGLKGHIGVANDFVRAELGMETLEARREKLRLGYWRRIFVANQNRVLVVVARLRRQEVMAGRRESHTSWMWGTRRLLVVRGMRELWETPELCFCVRQGSARFKEQMKIRWKKLCYEEVEEHHDVEIEARMAAMPSMSQYCRVKEWGELPEELAVMQAESGKYGMLVPERYLDDVNERLACHLKLLCRAGCLPTIARVCKELRDVRKIPLGDEEAHCRMCKSGAREDIEHIVLHCEAYATHRERMHEKAAEACRVIGFGIFAIAPACDKMDLLLGRSTGNAVADNNIDHAFKRFLKRAWRSRARLTRAINEAFDRSDIVDRQDAPTKLVSMKEARGVVAAARPATGPPAVVAAPGQGATPHNMQGRCVRRRLAL